MFLLYMLEECPFCKKVINHFNEKNIEFRTFNIKEPANLDELLILGGEDQVPFFIDTEKNVKMYESNDIIAYIDSL